MFNKDLKEAAPPRFGATEVASAAGISLRQLYYWERLGLLRPAVEVCGRRRFRRYSGRDLELLRKAKRLLGDGYTLQAAIRRATEEADPC